MAKQRRQRVADDGVGAGGNPEHAGPGDPLRQHSEKEVGGQLGLHGSLCLRRRAHLLGSHRIPNSVRRRAPPILGQRRRVPRPELPHQPGQNPRERPSKRRRLHREGDRAVLPDGDAGLLPVHFCGDHGDFTSRVGSWEDEHQGLDGFCPSLVAVFLYGWSFQFVGWRVSLPLGSY